jgi:hypothetical protein
VIKLDTDVNGNCHGLRAGIAGDWHGILTAGGANLRLALHIED